MTDELASTLEESAGYRSSLQTSLRALGESASSWCHTATEGVEAAAQAQLDLTQANKDALLSLPQVQTPEEQNTDAALSTRIIFLSKCY